ncbi:MAG: hypothetical protein AAGD35_05370 [Actinomycetota bacterium]
MGSPQQTNFSNQPIPQSWTDAAMEAPQAASPFQAHHHHPHRMRVVPGKGIDLFAASFSALATSMVTGFSWFVLSGWGLNTPWLALGVGLGIALVLRMAGGKGDVTLRIALSLMFYILTAGVIMLLITIRDYQALYSVTPSLAQLEDELIHGTLATIWTWMALASGGVVAFITSKFL